MGTSGRNRIAVPTHGDKSRECSTEAPFMAIGRGCNSIAPVLPQYGHIACLMSVQKHDAHSFVLVQGQHCQADLPLFDTCLMASNKTLELIRDVSYPVLTLASFKYP
jgi:hypothetical protein